ncbi:hypothetical protein Ocepr_2345 (plasmid) [Oceanithermus profundus DSM 14977]|uniref:Uncharacterized protein n=1 Tax=Oceanithermus profundus (strain DSM 14977 / NBRC 100410 / VKM B-2274 / 506) TaxID=670487 RepID=E4UAL4_OCEP5|nr:hypothetical protein Ocepr_2345 [Oceanithermus profundus DSM 14977]
MGLNDILDEACAISNVTAVCQIATLLEELGTNVEQFVDAGQGEVRKRLTGGLVDVVEGFTRDIASGVELPPELLNKLEEIANLPEQFREDYQAAWGKVDELKRALSDDMIAELRSLLQYEGGDDLRVEIDGEEVSMNELLAETVQTPQPCERLVVTSPMDDEYGALADACARERAARREKIAQFIAEASRKTFDYAQSSIQAAEQARRNEDAQRQIEGARILANAQASAERLASDYSLAATAKDASSRAKELADNAQNASSTRAAVQVLAEGMSSLLESNTASLAAVQMSLAELAQQQVYTNQQINRVASQTVKEVAGQESELIEEALADAAYFEGLHDAFSEQGESLIRNAEALFDTSCAKKPRWWEEGCP